MWSALATGLDLAGVATLLGTALIRAWIAGGIALPAERRLRALAAIGAAVALAAHAARLALQWRELPDGVGLAVLFGETRVGAVWLTHAALLTLAAAALAFRRGWTAAAVAAALALAVLPAGGHAAALEPAERGFGLATQIVHVVAGPAWAGSLLPLLLCVRQQPGEAALLSRRFSPFGVACVLLVAVSGVWSAWLLVGSVPGLVGTPYGWWTSAKIVFFLLMLGLATANRLAWTPRLAAGRAGALRGITASIAIEAALGLAALCAGASLATQPPSAHVAPWWPFPYRLGTELLAEPELRSEALTACVAMVGGLGLVALAIHRRRIALFALVPAAALFVTAAPTLPPFLVEAFPTTFQQSPTGFTAASIAHGAALFQEHCTACHGAEGRGDGPQAKAAAAGPADLTAAHVFDHSEGDLFWWISEGMPRGAMPGFAGAIDEAGRWALVDFVRANAAGHWPDDDPAKPKLRAPDFAFACPDGAQRSLSDLAGVAHLVFAPTASVAGQERRLGTLGLAEIGWTPGPKMPAPFCEALGEEIATAYAVLAGVPPDRIAGREFIVAGGWLRARGDAASWSDPAAFRAAVGRARTTPLPAAPRAAHVH
jgi:putative copper export protein/mono/diheme cytochrome c family protein